METNIGVLMPEVIIFKAINSMLKLIKDDYKYYTQELAIPDETKSLLYMFFKKDFNGNNIEFNELNYYDQAKAVFIDESVQVNMGYNLEVAKITSVHILLSSENGRDKSIGSDEGYVENIEYSEDTENDGNPSDYSTPVFTNVIDSTYNILITSENMFTVVLIYNLLKMGFLSLNENIEFQGLRNCKIGGQDVNIQSDLIPTHVFHKNFSLSFFYEISAPRSFRDKLIKTFTLVQNLTN